jgi:hypothetical protein
VCGRVPLRRAGAAPTLVSSAAGAGFFAHGCTANRESNGLTTSTKVHADGGRSDEKQQDISAGGVCTADVGGDHGAGSG